MDGQRARSAVIDGCLLLVCDDLGIGVTKSSMWNELMPVLHELTQTGATLSRSYTPHAICTPARAALLTGRMASTLTTSIDATVHRSGRTGLRHFTTIFGRAIRGRIRDLPPQTLPIDVSFDSTFPRGLATTTVASHLRELGFATGAFGKWHLSSGLIPTNPLLSRQGTAFCAGGNVTWTHSMYEQVRKDIESAGFEHSAAIYPCNVPASPYSHNLEWIVHHAERFIETAHATGRQFFAYVAWTLPHSPSARHALERSLSETPLPPEDVEHHWPTDRARKQRERVRKLMPSIRKVVPGYEPVALAWIDSAVGALVSTLNRLELVNNTLVIFTSDHGKVGKYSCREDGIRVPLFLRWPLKIVPGLRAQDMVSHLDLLPTILSAAGSTDQDPVHHASNQGRSVLPLLTHAEPWRSGQRNLPRTHLVCETYMDRAVIGTHKKLIWRAAEPWRTARPGTPQTSRKAVSRASAAACLFGDLAAYRLIGDAEGEPVLCQGHTALVRRISSVDSIDTAIRDAISKVPKGFQTLLALLGSEVSSSAVNVSLHGTGIFEQREMRWIPSNDSLVEMG